jgi:lipopolysaccharide biosynthesis glycosyltransferase
MTNKNEHIDFFVLINDISEKSKNIFKSFCVHNCNINIIDVSENIYKNMLTTRHLTSSMFIKFDIANILNNYEKILYLDGDTIIVGSLHELNNIDISNYYGAVVKDFGMLTRWRDENIESIKLNQHFNSGQMLLNLKKMRENNIPKKLLLEKLKNP